MCALRKHISSRYPFQLILLCTKYLQIPGQCRTVAAYIYNSLRFHLKYRIQQCFITALSRRIYHDNICVDTVLVIFSRQYFFCLSNKEFHILNSVDLRIFSCVVNGLWNDLHTADKFCSLCQEQRDGSDSAVQIPDSFISGKACIFQSFSIQFFGLDRIDLKKGQRRNLI